MNKALYELKVIKESSLIDYLINNIKEKSKNNIKNMIVNNCVYINEKPINKIDYNVKPNDKITIIKRKIKENNYEIEIIYEDDYLIGINKPSKLLSVSDNKGHQTAYKIVSNYVKQKNKNNKIFILHRLDRDTSGILLFAKNQKIKYQMQEKWDEIVLKRGYLAITQKIDKKSDTIKSYLYEDKNYNVKSTNNSQNGKLAITNYTVIKSNKKYSLLQIFIKTGRKNQIRVHMNLINTSIIGDKKYGNIKSDRLYLHANTLEFTHPITKKITTINCYFDQNLI